MEPCKKCDLVLSARHQIGGEGESDSDVMFLYDYPTHAQNKQGQMFVGKIMNEILTILNEWSVAKHVYHAHVMKCRPDKIESWDYKQVELRSHYCSTINLAKDFVTVGKHLKIIVTFGKFPYQFISGNEYMKYDDYLGALHNPHVIGDYIVYALPNHQELWKNKTMLANLNRFCIYYIKNFNHVLAILSNNKAKLSKL